MATVKTVAADFIAAELPSGLKGWKLDGLWINGSDKYTTAAEMLKAYNEYGLTVSKKGTSYILNSGDFMPVDEAKVRARIESGAVVKRSGGVTIDLNALLEELV